MTGAEKIAFKLRLKTWALDLIGTRITAAKDAIDQVQQAANQEEKSSAGDKYETGRAMGHLQKDMFARQMAEHIKEQATLHAVNVETPCMMGQSGAFLQCGAIAFFIAAGLGKQVVEGQTIFFLSPQAPLAKLLQNKKAGDSFLFNGATPLIHDIF